MGYFFLPPPPSPLPFSRDGLSKALYARLFSWLVQRINSIMCKQDKHSSIAVLDIFGFEVHTPCLTYIHIIMYTLSLLVYTWLTYMHISMYTLCHNYVHPVLRTYTYTYTLS